GKALGGGIVPVSAVVGRHEIMDVLTPGSHGSTFGGNPLACAIGSEVVRMVAEGEIQERAASLGTVMGSYLSALPEDSVSAVRRIGLWAGVDVARASGRDAAVALAGRGVLAKEAHGRTLRLSPPLVIEEEDLRWAMEQLSSVLELSP
ncbi:MAG: aminotransferase class III-fold pyridoxal phosphate-dependent enzyme, partial [Acidimicrobiales bacterium]